MKRLLTTALVGLLVLVTSPCLSQQTLSMSGSLGLSYLNQTLAGEKLPNLVTQDVSLALNAPDAFAEYRVQLHQDEIFRQQIKAGMQWKNIRPFYSLDLIGGTRFNGGGITFSQADTGKTVTLSALYREGGCGFEVKIQKLTGPICGSIGYSYDKYREMVIMGPSVELGVVW